MSDFSRLAINQYTTLHQWSLPQAIDGYARHGVHAIGIVWDKLQEVGVAEAKRLLQAHDMKVTCLCVGGLLTDSDPGLFRANLESTRRTIDEAAKLDAECVVFVAGGLPAGSRDLAAAPSALPGGSCGGASLCESGRRDGGAGTVAPDDLCVPFLFVHFGAGKRLD